MNKEVVAERFWNKVDKTNDCWIWTASIRKDGYGRIRVDGQTLKASRVAYYLTHGRWPIECMHTCDNPLCVNPRHLVNGTHRQNIQDMVNKKRHVLGERNGNAKLTEENVKQIRELSKLGTPRKNIAQQFKVSYVTITFIVTGRSWSHV